MESAIVFLLLLIFIIILAGTLWQDHLEKAALKKQMQINSKARKVWNEMAKTIDSRRAAIRDWVRNHRQVPKDPGSE